MVKLGTLCFGSPGSVPGRRPTPLVGSHAMAATHIQNRGRVTQMLAQAKSSSGKKRMKKSEDTLSDYGTTSSRPTFTLSEFQKEQI